MKWLKMVLYTHIWQHGFEFFITSYSDSVPDLVFIWKQQVQVKNWIAKIHNKEIKDKKLLLSKARLKAKGVFEIHLNWFAFKELPSLALACVYYDVWAGATLQFLWHI